MKIKIRNKEIGPGIPTYVIAEAACNHLCDMDRARKMIYYAAEVGADAIKFQTYKAEELVTPKALTYWSGKPTSQLEYYKQLDKFGEKEYTELFQFAKEKGLVGFSTPFDIESAQMLNELGMEVFKIASCSITDHELLETIENFGKPVILSCGGASIDEIDYAIDILQPNLALLFCIFGYPTPIEKAQLGRFHDFRDSYFRDYNIIVGFSDHTEPDPNMIIPALLVSAGASIIEKHFTLDRTLEGSGNFYSTEPKDFQTMIQNIRIAELVTGDPDQAYEVLDYEIETAKGARRCIVAMEDIPRGQKVGRKRLGIRRPGDGIDPECLDEVADMTTEEEIEVEGQLTWKKLKE